MTNNKNDPQADYKEQLRKDQREITYACRLLIAWCIVWGVAELASYFLNH